MRTAIDALRWTCHRQAPGWENGIPSTAHAKTPAHAKPRPTASPRPAQEPGAAEEEDPPHVDGPVVRTPYGTVQVQVVAGNRISDVRALHLTDANDTSR